MICTVIYVVCPHNGVLGSPLCENPPSGLLEVQVPRFSSPHPWAAEPLEVGGWCPHHGLVCMNKPEWRSYFHGLSPRYRLLDFRLCLGEPS